MATDPLDVSVPERDPLTIRHRRDGFDFSPYRIKTPIIGPLRLPLRFTDTVTLDRERASMTDQIELRLLGLLVGAVTIHLHPTDA